MGQGLTSSRTLSRRKIIIAEDDRFMRSLLRSIVEENCRDDIAVCGTIADAMCAFCSNTWMAIVDLGLGQEDGIDLIRRIRAERGQAVEILVVSAAICPARKVDALDAGATSFVAKPFSIARVEQELIRATKRFAAKPRYFLG
jgi:DNA-binding response OmpR family regulator